MARGKTVKGHRVGSEKSVPRLHPRISKRTPPATATASATATARLVGLVLNAHPLSPPHPHSVSRSLPSPALLPPTGGTSQHSRQQRPSIEGLVVTMV
ncbi:hypothetical protein GUJ93_ZPchr0353g2931 [Zizania palustris]|uniref:Uncharacterized protein n=1 Tax=Zizania palustris TaxID=103762 RepID=A0A8J5RBQ9_ZIZPA|nr:hypothetical protein GUJ93_ZPchr0353g2931 [Zizania palustris]